MINRESASALRAATGLRNRIAHGYALLDYDKVQREAREGIPSIRTFLVAAATSAGI